MNDRRSSNVDPPTVAGFGHEWSAFDQSRRSRTDLRATFDKYFHDFPWDRLPPRPVGLDAGCGSGRWALFASERATIHGVDASDAALRTAERLLAGTPTTLTQASVGQLPFPDNAVDFAYSLGVLHHTPDPAAGLADIVRVVKPGAPVLIYVYYALDDRPGWFRAAWRLSDRLRRWLSRRSDDTRTRVSTAVAVLVYWPLSRVARLLERRGLPFQHVPLAAYRGKNLFVLRTDALDRLGTRIEFRYSRSEVVDLLAGAGLTDIRVSDSEPFWCVRGRKPHSSSRAPDTG